MNLNNNQVTGVVIPSLLQRIFVIVAVAAWLVYCIDAFDSISGIGSLSDNNYYIVTLFPIVLPLISLIVLYRQKFNLLGRLFMAMLFAALGMSIQTILAWADTRYLDYALNSCTATSTTGSECAINSHPQVVALLSLAAYAVILLAAVRKGKD